MTQIWDCTDARPSLGVYVLGAIDPAERALVDAHLLTCQDCRDELAGLAGLPALLARVNPDEVSRICADDTVRAGPHAGADDQPPDELIGTVLDLAEAAATLGIPAGTVKSRTFYALKALKLALQERGLAP